MPDTEPIINSTKINAIRASEGKLIVEAPKGEPSVVVNAKEFAGSADAWHGDTLTQSETGVPLVFTFQ